MLKFLSDKQLLLGRDYQLPSIAQEKRAILTGQIALLCLLICAFFTVSDLITGYTESFFLYIVLTAVGLSSLLLLRHQYYRLSKTILMLGANLVIFVAFEREGLGTAAYTFFVPCVIGSFAIFGYDNKNMALVLFFVSVGLFLTAVFTDVPWIEKADFTPADERLYFVNNYIIALLTCILVIFFLIKLNHHSELSLIKTSEELLANKIRFDLAIRGSSVGIWDWNIAQDQLLLSPLLLEQLGYPEEKYQNMTSEKIDRVVHPDDLAEVQATLRAHIRDKKPYYHEFRIRKGDDSYYWVLVSGQAQWDKEGKPVRMIGTVVDITESKEALKKLEEKNEQLEKANDELDRFVYSTSHDLKAPLSSISGLVNIAKMANPDEEIVKCLAMIENRIEAMNGFIAEIIDYSRNTRLEVNVEEIQLKAMVRQLIDGLHYYHQSEKISFVVAVDESLIIHSDRGRLKVILNNLISNAIKYHDLYKQQPFIRVSAMRQGHSLLIQIEDNGQGIAAQYHEQLFNMFFRASENSEGSGLGLYIAKEMAIKLGGDITFTSERGVGSTFKLVIAL